MDYQVSKKKFNPCYFKAIFFKVQPLYSIIINIAPVNLKNNIQTVMFLLIMFSLLKKVWIPSKLSVHTVNHNLIVLLTTSLQHIISHKDCPYNQ
jgi:hypothetical protein